MDISEINPDGNTYTIKDKTARAQVATLDDRITALEESKIFSGEETDTGAKWINGKKIYSQAFQVQKTIPANQITQIIPLSDLAEIDDVVGLVGGCGAISGNFTSGGGARAAYTYRPSDSPQGIAMWTLDGVSSVYHKIIIFYTKSE